MGPSANEKWSRSHGKKICWNKQENIPVGCVPPALYRRGSLWGVSLTETPGQRTPWTETSVCMYSNTKLYRAKYRWWVKLRYLWTDFEGNDFLLGNLVLRSSSIIFAIISSWPCVFFTARKRSLGQGSIFRSVCQEFCPRGRGVVSQHALQVVSQHALQVSGGWYPSMPCRSQAHTQGRSWGVLPGGLQAHTQEGGGGLQANTQGGSWGFWPRGLQAHTQGGWGSPGPHPKGSPGPHGGGYPSIHWGRPPNRWLLLWVVCILLECILILGSIQTELERDREWEQELNQYCADPFTLQWELEPMYIEIYCTRHHKFPCKVTV